MLFLFSFSFCLLDWLGLGPGDWASALCVFFYWAASPTFVFWDRVSLSCTGWLEFTVWYTQDSDLKSSWGAHGVTKLHPWPKELTVVATLLSPCHCWGWDPGALTLSEQAVFNEGKSLILLLIHFIISNNSQTYILFQLWLLIYGLT